jgi:hypothetical protein
MGYRQAFPCGRVLASGANSHAKREEPFWPPSAVRGGAHGRYPFGSQRDFPHGVSRGVLRKVRFATKAPHFQMLGKFFKVLSNNVALTAANEGPVTILNLLELLGPLPQGTTRERLAEAGRQDR